MRVCWVIGMIVIAGYTTGQVWEPVSVTLQLPSYPQGWSLGHGTMTGDGHGFWGASIYLSPSSGTACRVQYTENEWTDVTTASLECGMHWFEPWDDRTVFVLRNTHGYTWLHSMRIGVGGYHTVYPLTSTPYAKYFIQPLGDTTCMVLMRHVNLQGDHRIDLRKMTPHVEGELRLLWEEEGNAHAMAFRDEQTGVVVINMGDGPREVWLTEDGGLNWQVVLSDTALNANNVAWLDDQTLWVIGDDGLILSSTDMGVSWTLIGTPEPYALLAIASYSADSVWVGGANGMIHATGDGGQTWLSHQFVDSLVTRIHAFEGAVYAYTLRPGPYFTVTRRLHKWKRADAEDLARVWWRANSNGIGLQLFEDEALNEFRLFDVAGREVRATVYGRSVPLEHLPAGIYLARMHTDLRTVSDKVFWQGRP